MDSGPVRVMASAGALLLTLTLTGAGGNVPDPAGPPWPSRGLFTTHASGTPVGTERRCTVSEILEPSCGVWWGGSPHENRLEELERNAGRRMDIVYTWRGIDQAKIPGDRERRILAEGRFVHTNIEARRFTRSGHPAVSYRAILGGEFDSVLRDQARGVAELETPYFLTFDHEADANKRYNKRGTPQEFTRAWRHIVDIYRDEGADNAIWVWNVTGWKGNLGRLPGLWPGNDHVDWISWEAYNMTGCDLMPNWKHVDSFEDALRPAYEWIQNEGPRHGIDPTKPVMIGEMGTTDIGPRETMRWYTDVPQVLREYERIRAVKVWDSKVSSGCDFRIGANRYARQGFEAAGRDPYVNLPDRVRRLAEHAHRD
ncbi:glycosyl hydrolase family 26 [Nocardiopsis sp. N85]|uniref:glycoside hydrolase family 26 protein n=1 Tax=Nocardiopsis sp. N85 TaxID=3029400 RepID=UPI00237EEBC3|nr:glycosyl hydrolase family 26 [Nocardiopsis sp. N85]MDE3720570.1 glycosyl hydrolase family 26 [Nocardiopsis sp. N85]